MTDRQLIVVANRLPVRSVLEGKERRWVTSPGGLVSALAPVMTARKNAAWVGWSGASGEAPEPFDHDGLRLHPISLTRADLQQYYEGFSNATLWPLYHDSISIPEYHRTWWNSYLKVNKNFADQIIELAEPDATIWVHDYQLQLLPTMLRSALPNARIGFFLHIPWPARELFLRLPWRRQIVEGLLGADVIGFQTQVMAHNFRHVVPRLIDGATVRGNTVTHSNRDTIAKTFPIGIDNDRFAGAASTGDFTAKATQIREQLGNPSTVLLGVDRLDYTKGIDRRLQAFRELLDEERLSADDVVMLQVAEPSRSNVNGYDEIRGQVEQLVGEINGRFGNMTRQAVQYLHRSHNFEELMALYELADVMVVTPFRDGMNLVAKEYVATRVNNTGVLVLSEFAGSANELDQAVLVNPYDTEGLKDALERAVLMDPAEQKGRMANMRRKVKRNSADNWAANFLRQLEDSQ